MSASFEQDGLSGNALEHHHRVLGLPWPVPELPDKDSLKAAYRRALLLYHPDKSVSSMIKAEGAPKASLKLESPTSYSVDDITKAYTVLSDPVVQRDYQQYLKGTQKIAQSRVWQQTTELEALDLEDMEYDEKNQQWTHACRCGNRRGFSVTEDDLLASEADTSAVSAKGEVLLTCPDCSHHVRILYELAEDENG